MEKQRVPCGKRIREALSIRKMKQIELCELTNIPKSALSQYISGAFEPKQDRIYLISKALNVSEAWLMGYDVPMEKQKTAPSDMLTEGEMKVVKLYRSLSEETRELLVETLQALDELPAEMQQMALQMLRGAGRQS